MPIFVNGIRGSTKIVLIFTRGTTCVLECSTWYGVGRMIKKVVKISCTVIRWVVIGI